MQDNHDVWDNSMDLAGLQNGSVIGFKYFNFEGLAQDTKGVKAFKGFNKQLADNSFSAAITTEGGSGKFKIHVMIDDPYKGREIAVIEDVVTDRKVTRTSSVQLSDEAQAFLADLKGKHAVYLVVEGPEVKQPEQPQHGRQFGQRQEPQRPKGLFTLHGIGFGAGLKMPVVPQVTITADGQKLNIPADPIRATNQNGLMDASTYQTYGLLKANTKIQVSSNVPEVTFTISPVTAGRATVKATYKGKTKTFLIN
jgi:hypothetical protein